MSMLMRDLINGTQLAISHNLTSGTVGEGTVGTAFIYYLVAISMSDNVNPVFVGNNILLSDVAICGTHLGSSNILKWTIESGADYYAIFKKPTVSGTLNYSTYRIVGGTIGTWVDDNIGSCVYTADFGTLRSDGFNYTNCIYLPETDTVSYNPVFNDNTVRHRLTNNNMVHYEQGYTYNATINFEQLGTEAMTDLKTVYNWKSDLAFYPNFNEKGTLNFKVVITGNFNYQLTTPSWINGGYDGQMQLTGIEKISNITETI